MKIRPVAQATEGQTSIREAGLPRPKVIDDLAHFQEISGALKLIEGGTYHYVQVCSSGAHHVDNHTNVRGYHCPMDLPCHINSHTNTCVADEAETTT